MTSVLPYARVFMAMPVIFEIQRDLFTCICWGCQILSFSTNNYSSATSLWYYIVWDQWVITFCRSCLQDIIRRDQRGGMHTNEKSPVKLITIGSNGPYQRRKRSDLNPLISVWCKEIKKFFLHFFWYSFIIFCNNLVFTICPYSNYIYILFSQIPTSLKLCLVFAKLWKTKWLQMGSIKVKINYNQFESIWIKFIQCQQNWLNLNEARFIHLRSLFICDRLVYEPHW